MEKTDECSKEQKSGVYPEYTDVFKASELKDAKFSTPYNFPTFEKSEEIPKKLVPFDKIFQAKEENYDAYVHFFLPDVCFERFWQKPFKYIEQLKKFAGCIMPDYSLCYDFPYPLQLYNCYRNRVLGYIIASNGIPVIMNVSFSDERSYDYCCNGIKRGGVIATGSLGTMKKKENRDFFESGLSFVIRKLSPSDLIIFGTVSKDVETICTDAGVKLHVFTPNWDGTFVTREASNG